MIVVSFSYNRLQLPSHTHASTHPQKFQRRAVCNMPYTVKMSFRRAVSQCKRVSNFYIRKQQKKSFPKLYCLFYPIDTTRFLYERHKDKLQHMIETSFKIIQCLTFFLDVPCLFLLN